MRVVGRPLPGNIGNFRRILHEWKTAAMGKTYDTIDRSLSDFLARQKLFFVATSPTSLDGHINLSPKGLDTFRVLDESSVVYADFVGSGIETIAHIKDNGRIVLMFCAFEGPPKIVRLHGTGEVIEPGHKQFAALRDLFPNYSGLRAFIRVHCQRISDSCGFGVPLYEYQGERTQLIEWAENNGEAKLEAYQRENNRESIDGLTGLEGRA